MQFALSLVEARPLKAGDVAITQAGEPEGRHKAEDATGCRIIMQLSCIVMREGDSASGRLRQRFALQYRPKHIWGICPGPGCLHLLQLLPMNWEALLDLRCCSSQPGCELRQALMLALWLGLKEADHLGSHVYMCSGGMLWSPFLDLMPEQHAMCAGLQERQQRRPRYIAVPMCKSQELVEYGLNIHPGSLCDCMAITVQLDAGCEPGLKVGQLLLQGLGLQQGWGNLGNADVYVAAGGYVGCCWKPLWEWLWHLPHANVFFPRNDCRKVIQGCKLFQKLLAIVVEARSEFLQEQMQLENADGAAVRLCCPRITICWRSGPVKILLPAL